MLFAQDANKFRALTMTSQMAVEVKNSCMLQHMTCQEMLSERFRRQLLMDGDWDLCEEKRVK